MKFVFLFIFVLFEFGYKRRFSIVWMEAIAGVTTNNDPRRIMTGGSLFYVEK